MYIKKRWLILFILIILAIPTYFIYDFFFSSDQDKEVCCVKPKVVIPSVLNISESTPISNLDSSKATETVTYNILNQVQEGLMRLGPKDVPQPALAQSYEVSSDYRIYTFTIRNTTWSDGKPLTAHDFLYAWKRALSPVNQYNNAKLFFPIHNAQAYNEGKVPADQLGISAPDEHHLVVQLDNPNPNFLSLTTFTPFFPLRQDLVEKHRDKYASTPEQMSFIGPFQLESVYPKRAVLIKNESYWDKANVKLPKVDIKIEVDSTKQIGLYNSELTGMIKLDPHYLNFNNKSSNPVNISRAITDYMDMNERRPLLQNLHIRKAIQLALNRDDMVDELKDGSSVADAVIPPALKTAKGEPFRSGISLPYRAEEAKTHLAQGLQELGLSQVTPLTLLTYNDQHSIILANKAKEQLKAIGIDVEIKQYDPGEKAKLDANGEYDLSISEWSVDYHDPSSFLFLWHSGVNLNVSGFQDVKYDALLDQAKNEVDPAKQVQLYQQAEKYLLSDQAVIMPLVHIGDLRLQKSYVKGVLYHPFGAEYTLKWATYQPKK